MRGKVGGGGGGAAAEAEEEDRARVWRGVDSARMARRRMCLMALRHAFRAAFERVWAGAGGG